MTKHKTKTNTKVLCPVDDCKKGFDNRGRVVNHMKSGHDPEDIVEQGEPERIGEDEQAISP